MYFLTLASEVFCARTPAAPAASAALKSNILIVKAFSLFPGEAGGGCTGCTCGRPHLHLRLPLSPS